MGANVALVVLDSVRKDYFDDYFYWLPGIWFNHAWSTGNYSIPAHGSLFGGKYPSELGVHAKSRDLDCPEPVLAELLSANGYRTRAYSANELIGPDFGFDRGFAEFNLRWDISDTHPDLYPWRDDLTGDDGVLDYLSAGIRCLLDRDTSTIPSFKRAYEIYSYRDDGITEALHLLDSIDFGEEEFLFMNLMEAHWPYWGEGEYLTYDENPLDEQPATITGGDVDLSAHEQGYEDCLEYLADMYKDLHQELSSAFDYVITISDHGDMFGEHGAKAHYYGIYRDLTRIPVVISDGTDEMTYRDDVVSLVDINATIRSIAGIETDPRGVDLLSHEQHDPRLIEFHGFDQNRLDILESRGFDEAEIEQYDQYLTGIAMNGGYYGHETEEEFMEYGAPEQDPRAVLDSLLERIDRREAFTEAQSISERTLQRLEELGYR